MSKSFPPCFLRCLTSRHPDIPLQHNIETVLGRGPVTKITDPRCSRKQLSLVSDHNAYQVKVTQIGLNTSQANKKDIGVKKSVTLGHEDSLNVLSNLYEYKVIFDPPPTKKESSENDVLKRLNSGDHKMAKKLKTGLETERKTESTRAWFDDSLGTVVTEDDGRGGQWRRLADGRLFVRMVTGDQGQSKIAAFDIDGTLITTKSGRVFPVDEHDWRIIFSEVPGKLKKLVEDGYKLVFITNQAGIAKGKLTIQQFSGKVTRILARLGVSATVFVSTADTGYFRKPRPGIWEWLEARGNSDVSVSRDESFYCGDAAGREAGFAPGKKKDFSCSDRLFADNVGVKFLTPEEFFLGHKPTTKFNRPFLPSRCDNEVLLDPTTTLVPSSLTLSLMVGIQGSGKSHIAEAMAAEGVVVASNDVSGGKEKTLRIVEAALGRGQSVVVDNTHVDSLARRSYLELGLRHGARVRALVMATSHDQARHNNIFRELTDSSHTRIKEMLFNQYRAKHVPPSLEEGFSEIVRVNCVPKFDDEKLEKLYYMYLLEK